MLRVLQVRDGRAGLWMQVQFTTVGCVCEDTRSPGGRPSDSLRGRALSQGASFHSAQTGWAAGDPEGRPGLWSYAEPRHLAGGRAPRLRQGGGVRLPRTQRAHLLTLNHRAAANQMASEASLKAHPLHVEEVRSPLPQAWRPSATPRHRHRVDPLCRGGH